MLCQNEVCLRILLQGLFWKVQRHDLFQSSRRSWVALLPGNTRFQTTACCTCLLTQLFSKAFPVLQSEGLKSPCMMPSPMCLCSISNHVRPWTMEWRTKIHQLTPEQEQQEHSPSLETSSHLTSLSKTLALRFLLLQEHLPILNHRWPSV